VDLVEELLPNMRRVSAAERDLRELGLLWSTIEASSAIGCPREAQTILPTLAETRDRFADLQQRLVRQLGQEGLAELAGELGSAAQCGIDILVRNLFERTADVGFLATDEVLCSFCAAPASEQAAQRSEMQRRLAEYRAKYTVYDDIIVLNREGQVLVRLDDSAELQTCRDPLLAEALARPGYVEYYGVSTLAPGGAGSGTRPDAASDKVLLYAHRIEQPAGRLQGVLVLRFRLADELTRIFEDLASSGRSPSLLMLDAQQRVVASNDTAHVPLGARLQMPQATDGHRLALLNFAGREYLAVQCPTRGYQGYGGPGWSGLAMVSLTTAFRQHNDNAGLPLGVALDNDELRQVQVEVDAINRNLRRVVWNGRLLANARGELGSGQLQLKAVLQQINSTGGRMRARAGAAIQDLYRSSLGRAQQQADELARLAADIMDRNLYERANDCRWWALAPVLAQGLAGSADTASTQRMNAVLAHINDLYTVYTRLIAFDVKGRIRALTHDSETQPLQGQAVPAHWLQGVMTLTDSQRYAVTPFEACAATDGMPTYVYLAAVRAGSAVVGGVAIVFHAEREFKAMVCDVLDGRAGLAAFVDTDGRVIACSDDSLVVGEKLPFAAERGIVAHLGAHHAVAVVEAKGYREFKQEDGYRNGVRAVIALRLGRLERRKRALYDVELRAAATPSAAVGKPDAPAAQGRTRELAMFQVGTARYAVPVEAVMEALPARGMVRLVASSGPVVGLLDVGEANGGRVLPVLCARQIFGVSHSARSTDGVVLILVDPERPGQAACGLRVDDLNSVLDVEDLHIQATPPALRARCDWLAAVVRLQTVSTPREEVLAQLVEAHALLARAGRPQLAASSMASLGAGVAAG
jgi:chemotaxis signal transduction protein